MSSPGQVVTAAEEFLSLVADLVAPDHTFVHVDAGITLSPQLARLAAAARAPDTNSARAILTLQWGARNRIHIDGPVAQGTVARSIHTPVCVLVALVAVGIVVILCVQNRRKRHRRS